MQFGFFPKKGQESISLLDIYAISALFGYPKEKCAKILVEAAIKFVKQNSENILTHICFTNRDIGSVTAFEDVVDALFGAPEGNEGCHEVGGASVSAPVTI